MDKIKTRILNPTHLNIKKAANAILKGELVGMPTETVYGLAANALDSDAVAKIFVAKNRPQDNPLIVHIHKDYNLFQLVKDIPDYASRLLKAFTPGPLTLVFKSKGNVSPLVSRGLQTIAIRIPDHRIAQKFLKACNVPIAAPSANISSRMSATTAVAVKEELDGKLPFILNAGKCKVGIESTVVDVTGKYPVILRPGRITKEMIEHVVGITDEKTTLIAGEKAISPGMKYRHYAPSCPVILVGLGEENSINQKYEIAKSEGKNPVIICMTGQKEFYRNKKIIIVGKTVKAYAKNLYSALRIAEKHYDYILMTSVKTDNLGSALMNRLNKISGKT
ncbi:MAG: L-threonylcarbamoyladenylate synthase [Clostridia bacterium]|jgi:L-threonylcarbamoyladenylate synthase|nr:L-threonylcarbamoyladenylate synthase [Clostridia bacterium]